MKTKNSDNKNIEPAQLRELRLLPGIVIVTIQWLIRFIIPEIFPADSALMAGVFAGIVGGLALAVWWMFFSRALPPDRFGAIVLIIVALFAASFFLDVSIATANVGLMFTIFSIPVMSLAFVVWAVASRHLSLSFKRATMIITILLASGFWILIRTDGMDAQLHHDFAWRWAATDEEKLIAKSKEEPVSAASHIPAATAGERDWPGFRGADRDGIVRGTKIATDWKAAPPAELWRRQIGPGCSSFSVRGNLFYTQEQLGEYEIVSCYDITTGKAVWKHRDKTRFYDSHAGAGPRSTPTLEGNYVYTLGATGILNAMDASDGSVLWSRNSATETGTEVLPWGFTGSPLVFGDLVIIALSGKLAAYDIKDGKPLWTSPDGGHSYSSPQIVTIDSVPQVLLMSKAGAVSYEPSSGMQLWNYSWPVESRILQPAVIAPADLIIAGEAKSARRVTISHESNEWTVKELWTSEEMKLNFNDFIVHKGYAYGFDGPRIACIDIKDGKLRWRGNPYRGFILLLADNDLILVLTEKGDLALIEANPDKFIELSRIPAIKGKTWNHPAMAGDVVLVRNAVEMAAFRLSHN